MKDEKNYNKEESDEESNEDSAEQRIITNESISQEYLSNDSISLDTESIETQLKVREFRYEDLVYWVHYVPPTRKKEAPREQIIEDLEKDNNTRK